MQPRAHLHGSAQPRGRIHERGHHGVADGLDDGTALFTDDHFKRVEVQPDEVVAEASPIRSYMAVESRKSVKRKVKSRLRPGLARRGSDPTALSSAHERRHLGLWSVDVPLAVNGIEAAHRGSLNRCPRRGAAGASERSSARGCASASPHRSSSRVRQLPWRRSADSSDGSEELPFDSIWTGEAVMGQGASLEPMTLLAYAAALTDRVRLGCAVILLPLRAPVTLARAAAAVDQLSGGRLDLGIGMGDDPSLVGSVGLDPALRVDRFVEGLAGDARPVERRSVDPRRPYAHDRWLDHEPPAWAAARATGLVRWLPPGRATARRGARRRLDRRRWSERSRVRA